MELSLCDAINNSNNGADNKNDKFRLNQNTVGKYVKLQVPEISIVSHPFTIFANPKDNESVRILFRPCGSFTTNLSKRLKALTLLPEPTPSEIENHHRTFFSPQTNGGSGTSSLLMQSNREKSCPKMLINGIRCGTTIDSMSTMLQQHARIVIISGGVGIVSYISLIHALRQWSVMMMRNASIADNNENSNDVEGGDYVDDAMLVNNHRRLIYNDGSYDDVDDDDLKGRQQHGFPQDDNGVDDDNGENGGAPGINAAMAKDNDWQDAKKQSIDVHWMSRDEGLIRHVLENYLEPFCNNHHSDGRGIASSMISINIVIHHTSQHVSPSSLYNPSENDDNVNSARNVSGSEPTTWQPSEEYHHRIASMTASTSSSQAEDSIANSSENSSSINSSSSSALFALPESIYQGNKPSLSQNIFPAITYASIAFGGLWIVDYCYANVQDKHVVETRPIAVLGILILAMMASAAFNAIVIVINLCYSKLLLFRYTKLESSGGNDGVTAHTNGCRGEEEIGNGEIECCSGPSPVADSMGHDGMESQQRLSNDEDNVVLKGHDHMSSSDLDAHPSRSTKEAMIDEKHNNAIMKISHSAGRPNLEAIVQDAIKEEEERLQELEAGIIDEGIGHHHGGSGMGVGVFMCGPTAMTGSVWNAIKKEEHRRRGGSSCKAGACESTLVSVYQESFEL